MKRGMSIFLFAILTAAFTARYPIAGWAQGVERKPPTLHGGQETLQRGIEKEDIRRVAFLFLSREGSISPEALKAMVESVEMTIKEKSRPTSRVSGGQAKELEQITLEELGGALSRKGGGEGTEKRGTEESNIASGAKLTKADAARKVQSPTLGELFQKHGPVLVLNLVKDPPQNAGPDWIKVWPPNSLPRYMGVLDIGGSARKRPGRTKVSNLSVVAGVDHVVVFTFDQESAVGDQQFQPILQKVQAILQKPLETTPSPQNFVKFTCYKYDNDGFCVHGKICTYNNIDGKLIECTEFICKRYAAEIGRW